MARHPEPVELPAPVPGLSHGEYREIAGKIAAGASHNALVSIRRGDVGSALDAMSDGLRLLQNVVVLADDAGPEPLIDLADAAMNPQFGGMAGMATKASKSASHGRYEPTQQSSQPAPLEGAAGFARARQVQLRQRIERIKSLSADIASRGDTLT